MNAVVLIDTSILCEILAFLGLGKSDAPGHFQRELKRKETAREILLLPMAAVIETGNHVGRCSGDGNVRRRHAEILKEIVLRALDGRAPFTPTRGIATDDLRTWLAAFPSWAQQSDERGKGSGLADLSIKFEFDRACELNRGRRVYVWSRDRHLARCDRGPEIGA